MHRRLVLCAVSGLAAAALSGMCAPPAGAHAIIELNGVSAVAGGRSLMTLEEIGRASCRERVSIDV